MRIPRSAVVAIIAVGGLALAACGDDSSKSPSNGGVTTVVPTTIDAMTPTTIDAMTGDKMTPTTIDAMTDDKMTPTTIDAMTDDKMTGDKMTESSTTGP